MKLLAYRLNLLVDDARAFIDRLEFASYDEYLAAISTTIRDVRAASVSSIHLAQLLFRPGLIFLGILGHYLIVFLRLLAGHSVYHGWIAVREGYYQLQTATIWYIKFQKNLSTTAKHVQVGALVTLAFLWLARRHVRKQRYVERIVSWYMKKKHWVLRKYRHLVERVEKTSSFLALLLPHLLYVSLVLGTKRIIPSVITYFATRTYLCSFISFWHPLYITVTLLGRLSPHLGEHRNAEALNKATSNGSKSTKKSSITPTILKQQKEREIQLEMLRVEVIDMLKYWVVYAVLLATVRTGKLLPFIGHVLNVTTTDVDLTTVSKSFRKVSSKAGLFTNLRLRGKFVDELTLIFFIWLCRMPASITGDNAKESITTALSPKNSNISKGVNAPGKSSPVDILYAKISPLVLAAMNSSAFLTKRAFGDSPIRDRGNGYERSTFVSAAIQKLHSMLNLLVLVRLISEESKDWLITTIVESSALLPAVTTLLMPSYFTSYGVIYVSLVVPAGYSISSCNFIRGHRCSKQHDVDTLMPIIDDSSRYLQFWMVHAALSILLASFSPLLAWIPLSTHATWLLWAYIQLESSTRRIYGWFEAEIGKKSLDETAIARMMRRIIDSLPSGAQTEKSDEATATPLTEGAKLKDD